MERYKEIERSIITTYRGKIWGKFIKALKEYELLQPNDNVCVCISGGKDSMLLAKCFQELKRHSDFDFDVKYMVMDPGYNKENRELIEYNAKIMNVPITIVETDIFEAIDKMGGNPCYMCAKMRRGALYRNALALGCNKIALGHHFDDVIETILMSIFYTGRYQGMMPKLKSDNFKGMELIRPFFKVKEKDIIAWKNYNNLNFLQCACKFTAESIDYDDGSSDSKRKEMKNLIKKLKETNGDIDKNIFHSMHNVNLDTVISYTKNKKEYSFLDDYLNEDDKNE